MEGTVNNFRQGRHTIKMKHMIITVPKVDTREKAEKLVGKKVTFKTQTGKEIVGEVRAPHGNNGAIRAIFEKGLPGQSIGQKVKVE
jgi:large subunit ribosomal protein L35Ae